MGHEILVKLNERDKHARTSSSYTKVRPNVMRVIQKIRWILTKALALGSIVYSCIFEINNDGSFYVSEDCQHDLIYWLLYPELFLYWRVSVLPLHQLSFRHFAHSGKPMFSPFVKIFLTKICFFVKITHCSENFIWVTLSHQEFDDRPLFKPGALFGTNLNCLKRNIFARLKWLLL